MYHNPLYLNEGSPNLAGDIEALHIKLVVQCPIQANGSATGEEGSNEAYEVMSIG